MDDCYKLKLISTVAYLTSQPESETAQATNQTFYRESSFEKNAEKKWSFSLRRILQSSFPRPAKPLDSGKMKML